MEEQQLAAQAVVDRSAAYRTRTIRDLEGRTWIVRETPLPAFDRRSGSCLIFERAEVVRRVRNFPANWLDLSEKELSLVCESI